MTQILQEATTVTSKLTLAQLWCDRSQQLFKIAENRVVCVNRL
ncbi:hypothetical protein [Aerosakkonema funiforme]|nr:hypothetical protein [Aerosakkonema funiforme]